MNKFSFVHTSEHSYNYVKSLFRDVCANAATEVSKNLLSLNDLGLSKADIDPRDYSNPSDFSIDYSLVKYLSKWKGLNTGIDTKEVALLAFKQQEVLNKSINRRLASNATSIVDPILHRASRLCAKVLGDFNMDLFDGLEDWGPGATTDMSRRRAQMDSKITNFPIPVTYEAREVLERAIVSDLHWSFILLGDFPVGPYSMLPSCFIINNFSQIVTVPKNSKTDRTIAIEPRGNMFLQKGVGSFIRQKLLRHGVNLNDQSRNQTLASLAKDLSLATIDLSMASDSITTELVWLLLPYEWAAHLDRLRSKFFASIEPNGPNVKFEKFSSMGNGFTFELESLIFYSLVRASQDDDNAIVAIYGDDIICPQDSASRVICALNYCGFAVNESKSYVEGNFFESCGAHYFNGVYVTPMYQKEEVLDDFEALRFLNRMARFLIRSADGDKLVGPWCEPWRHRVANLLRSHDAPSIPFGTEGDEGLLVNHSLFTPRRYKKSYGFQWKTLTRKQAFVPADEAALLAVTFRRGVVTESPFGGDLPSRSEKGLSRFESTKWIEPLWEFSLD